jgi:hypothetical protein
MPPANWLIPLPVAWFCVDFLSGFVHWLEDSYGSPDTPYLGRHIIAPNVLHHFEPRTFTKSSLWERNHVLWPFLAFVIAGLILRGAFSPFWLYFCLFASISGEAHVWAHRTRRENGWLITSLQRTYLVQTPRHHARHHTDPKRDSFCALTNFLNPLLDSTRFFRHLEALVAAIFRVTPRPDPSVRPERVARTAAKSAN